MSWGRSPVRRLDEHPNLAEILGVRAQVPHISDEEITRLAEAWHNTVFLADARARALHPDAPLILDVLAAFDSAQDVFAEDMAGEREYVVVEAAVAVTALKAVRDAIAAAYARPMISRWQYTALMAAWRTVYPTLTAEEPDLGPRAGEVKSCLAVLRLLATRCHDTEAARLFALLAQRAARLDGRIREAARTETWQAACLTSRRRLWAQVRRSGSQALGRPCPDCPPARRRSVLDHPVGPAVLELCLDAACALLVADAVDDNLTDALVLPLAVLIPEQRAGR